MVILFTKQAQYNFAAPSNAAVASKPVGQWNTLEIEQPVKYIVLC
jgi:hypothetical protein